MKPAAGSPQLAALRNYRFLLDECFKHYISLNVVFFSCRLLAAS